MPRACTLLIRIGQSHRQQRPAPSIIDLQGCAELRIGRGCLGEVRAPPDGHWQVLLDDSWVSDRHAVISRQGRAEKPSFVLTTTTYCKEVWASSDTDVWIACHYGVFHYDGTKATMVWQDTVQTTWGMTSIFGFGPKDIYIAGDDGRIFHCQ